MNHTLHKLSRSFALILVLLCLPSCQPSEAQAQWKETECSSLLTPTEDFGQEYLDSFIFFGESTTYHMKDREVLLGGKETDRVWAPDSGTVNLDHTVEGLLLRYPDTGELLTVGEAAAKKKPSRMMLTFGLNGAVQKIRRGERYYKRCYGALIQAIRRASPETRIVLQSAFPVAENMDMSRYSITAAELNRYIDRINEWTREVAEEYGLGYLNTAEILKNEEGFLYAEYQVGDGHHLTRSAYLEILSYIRTHGYE